MISPAIDGHQPNKTTKLLRGLQHDPYIDQITHSTSDLTLQLGDHFEAPSMKMYTVDGSSPQRDISQQLLSSPPTFGRGSIHQYRDDKCQAGVSWAAGLPRPDGIERNLKSLPSWGLEGLKGLAHQELGDVNVESEFRNISGESTASVSEEDTNSSYASHSHMHDRYSGTLGDLGIRHGSVQAEHEISNCFPLEGVSTNLVAKHLTGKALTDPRVEGR
jgi:hypothetical protein